MKAMILEEPGRPLRCAQVPDPVAGPHQVLLQVEACGVCRTDLHLYEGDLERAKLPLVLGHEIVGRVADTGPGVEGLTPGQRVGVPWLGRTCGECPYCRRGAENLCAEAVLTGYLVDGGYAEYAVAEARFCLPLPDALPSDHAAPLLCAGLIGYRAYRMAPGRRLGLYGFGAAAHIITQIAVHDSRDVYAFTRPGDADGQDFARGLGACWSGGSDALPPEPLDAAILFAPAGDLVPQALRAVDKGGTVVCAGIHMSDIPSFPYRLLWEERIVRSVANLTRRDGLDFFSVAPQVPVRTQIERFRLEQADEALQRLKSGRIQGAAVLVIGE